jgi:hypothetical protein
MNEDSLDNKDYFVSQGTMDIQPNIKDTSPVGAEMYTDGGYNAHYQDPHQYEVEAEVDTTPGSRANDTGPLAA